MNTFQSAEIRWFYRREQCDSKALYSWFLNIPGAIVIEQTTRVDYYYRLSQSPHFGIKLRMEGGGKSETKEQIRDYGPVHYHPNLQGIANDWLKWSFVLAEPEVKAAMLKPSWLAVEKKRWQQKYKIEQDDIGQIHISSIRANEFAPTGFSLEFTNVTIENEKWLSISFEAHDSGSQHRNKLDLGVQYILGFGEPPVFELADSMSYYGWLSNQCQQIPQ